MSHADELTRIRAEYDRRRREIPAGFYALSRPANLFIRHGQERALLAGLDGAGFVPLGERRVLEVGVGDGQWLETFLRFGARMEHLAGIDLDADAIATTRARYPSADLRAGDAAALPWASGSFDVVFQSTVFTSILDEGSRRAVAAEMTRVLRPGGLVVWYDFVYDNPRNHNVRGVKPHEIRALFPGMRAAFQRATLAPPLARWIAPRSWALATVLESARLLNTHCLAVLVKP
jgi:SAM-dependent methyltransferase